MNKTITLLLILIISFASHSQKKLAGIEFNAKEVKVLIIETKPDDPKEFKFKNFWTETTNIIDTDDRIQQLKKIKDALVYNLQKIKVEQNINPTDTYIIGEQELFNEIEMVSFQKDLLNNKIKNIDFLDNKNACKFLFDGLFDTSDKEDNFLLYTTENQTTFCSYQKKSEFVIATLQNSNLKKLDFILGPTNTKQYTELNNNIKQLFYYFENLKDKKNIYLAGDIAWASYALYNGGSIDNEFNPFKTTDIQKNQEILEKNFNRYEVLASANIEAEKVLSYFSKNDLQKGNKLFLEMVKYPEINKKEFLYCKNANRSRLANYLSNKLKNK